MPAAAVRARILRLGDIGSVAADPLGSVRLPDGPRKADLSDGSPSRMSSEAREAGDGLLADVLGGFSALAHDRRRPVLVEGLSVVLDPSFPSIPRIRRTGSERSCRTAPRSRWR